MDQAYTYIGNVLDRFKEFYEPIYLNDLSVKAGNGASVFVQAGEVMKCG